MFDIYWIIGIGTTKILLLFFCFNKDETECILKNYLFCHFHNKQFEKMIALEEISTMKDDDPDAWALSEHAYLSSSLPIRDVSCVRQLLDQSE